MINYLWENLFKRREDQVIKVLSDNILFKDLSSSELQIMTDFLHIRHYRPAELIFRQNEIGVGMYIILKGKVDIHTESNIIDDGHGGDFITRLEDGDFLGELSLIEENGRRTASARAMNECSLLGFFQPDLKNLLQSQPDIAAKILLKLSKVLGRRLSETATKITELKKQIDHIKA